MSAVRSKNSWRSAQPRRASRAALVLGDQLDRDSPALRSIDRERDAVIMMEVESEATHVPSHIQRTVLFLSAMRHFSVHLDERGYRVRYTALDDRDNAGSFHAELTRIGRTLGVRQLIVVQPGEHRVMAQLRRAAQDLDAELDILEDEHFLTTRDQFDQWAEGRKQLTMEHFYREQRRRLDVLLTNEGDPVGGVWNFDKKNREHFRAAPRPPAPYRARADDITREVINLVKAKMPDAPGRIDAFHWPVTRDQARRSLDRFIEDRLDRFGDHQDAMWTDEPWLYHAHLSPAMNLKLLDPRDVLDAALARHENNAVPLNSLEGFVRQIIGWREFIRGVYLHEGAEYIERNSLDQHGALPEFYWSGQTEMNCLRQCVNQVLDHGYAHHIQRLMVLGNFALIAGVAPGAMSDWFLGMFVDGVDWVTRPNTLGMAMHADGGVVHGDARRWRSRRHQALRRER